MVFQDEVSHPAFRTPPRLSDPVFSPLLPGSVIMFIFGKSLYLPQWPCYAAKLQ